MVASNKEDEGPHMEALVQFGHLMVDEENRFDSEISLFMENTRGTLNDLLTFTRAAIGHAARLNIIAGCMNEYIAEHTA